MATTVDEFGRVIPAAAPPSTSTAGGGGYYGSGSGGGGGIRGRSRSRDRSRHHHSHHHHPHHHPHHRDHHRDTGWRKRPRSPSTGPKEEAITSAAAGVRTTVATSRLRHPSYRYVEEPMLCEYVWKSQQEKEHPDHNDKDDNDNDDNAIDAAAVEGTTTTTVTDDASSQPTTEPATKTTTSASSEDYNEYRKRYCLNYVRSFFNTHMDDSWFRSRYSPLGRKRAVVAERERAKQEAECFRKQALESLEEAEAANADTTTTTTTTTDNDRGGCSFVQQARLGKGIKSVTENPAPPTHCLSFMRTTTTAMDSNGNNNNNNSNSNNNGSDHIIHITDVPPHVTDEQLTLALMDHCMIPPDQHAEGSPIDTPEGIQMVSGSVNIPTTTSTNTKKERGNPKHPLWREAFLICSAAVKQDILTHLHKAEQDGGTGGAGGTNSKTTMADKGGAADDEAAAAALEESAPPVVVPRKDKDREGKLLPLTLPLDVECSDPYGRLDVDADGKGGAPDDGVGVPPRKSTVWVRTQYKPPPVLVLSAAVSSKERLGRDKEAAIMMARALDVAKDIPQEQRLDEILDQLFGSNRNTEETNDETMVEDTLDVAIAYLRRIHLFSFYNGCTFSNNVADVLSGKHPAGTIHMRLKDADQLLAAEDIPKPSTTDDDNAATPAPPKDLLVQRLDDSIAKALEECNKWIESGGKHTIVDEQIDKDAEELEQAEEEWKNTWLENHAIIDDDGRARCSFHFCHKLFKDKTFLRKHLQKKHKEFLRAEIAQLHDEYMMKAWDGEDQRPVPPVLVDCGANFDLVPSAVVGAEPTAEDPEPELWRREEERRKREEELAQQRAEQRRNPHYHQDRHSEGVGGRSSHHHHHHHGGSSSGGPPPRVKNFVDVDDMKEEKVEMSFENVDVPVQPPKKKKKKKKLL